MSATTILYPSKLVYLWQVIGSTERSFGQCAECGKQFMSLRDRLAQIPHGNGSGTYRICERCFRKGAKS